MLPSAAGARRCLVTPLFAKFCAQKDPGAAWGCGEVRFLIIVILLNIWTKRIHQQFLKITVLLPGGSRKSSLKCRDELVGFVFPLKKEKSHKTIEQLQFNLQKHLKVYCLVSLLVLLSSNGSLFMCLTLNSSLKASLNQPLRHEVDLCKSNY